MKIILDSPINKYYVQTLGMIFFPGAHFSENEELAEGEPVLSVKTVEEDEGIRAFVTASVDEKSESAEYFAAFNPDRTKERVMKLAIGGAVLAAFNELLGYRPAWGMMMGVRPAKIASEMLDLGYSKTKVKRILNSDYLVIPKKAALATSIALTERSIIAKPSPKDCSVYIAIPFCPSRCAYCSFVSYTSKRLLSLIPEYLEKLKEDIRFNFETINMLGLNVKTVYIGGGTPTILTESQLEDLLSFISSQTDVNALEEYTLEAGRPDTITYEKFSIAKKYGVTRVSVNPQSLSDKLLESVGRSHSSEEFFKAFDAARRAGIKTVNVDLIAGLPGDEFKTFAYTYDEVLKLRPENLTVHTFCVKKSSELLKRDSSVYSLRGGSVGKCVDYSQIKADQAGYIPYYMYRQKNTVGNYENVGFALKGHEGYYNIYMMEEIHSIFAAGAGAVGKLVDNTVENCNKRDIERLFHQKYPYEYLVEDKNQAFREAALRFYREHGMLD